MLAFADGSVDVLVTTTVVEVGVDVPNATTMVIMDADRFGVSQLHQLRGRVGRGSHEGLCLLVTEAEADSPSRQRLDAVAATLDGFELSRLDLEQRREGDVLGAAQAGRRSSLKLLTLLADEDLIGRARHEATDAGRRRPGAGRPARAGRRGRRAARPASRRSSWRRPEAGSQMTRIIAGTAGGRRLAVPPGRAPGPTSDRAREGLFATVLGHPRHAWTGAAVLDLYAGLGRGRPGGAVPRRGRRAAGRVRRRWRPG